MALNAKSRACFLPSRASVAGQAKRALLEALKPAVNGQDQAEPRAFKGASTVAGATAAAGAAATKQSLQLFLHPRDYLQFDEEHSLMHF